MLFSKIQVQVSACIMLQHFFQGQDICTMTHWFRCHSASQQSINFYILNFLQEPQNLILNPGLSILSPQTSNYLREYKFSIYIFSFFSDQFGVGSGERDLAFLAWSFCVEELQLELMICFNYFWVYFITKLFIHVKVTFCLTYLHGKLIRTESGLKRQKSVFLLSE